MSEIFQNLRIIAIGFNSRQFFATSQKQTRLFVFFQAKTLAKCKGHVTEIT